jgi:ATP/maltotriose-dependent transcriptional regulator MalT
MLAEHVTRQGLVTRRPIANFYRAALAYMRGDASAGAIDGLKQAIDEFRDVNYLVRIPYYLSVQADALVHCGRLDEAETTMRTALDIARSQSEGWCLPELLRVQASTLSAQGRVGEAEAILVESIAHARTTGALSWRLRSAIDLAQLWRAQARAHDAREMLLSIHSEFAEGFETRDLVIAADLIAALERPQS